MKTQISSNSGLKLMLFGALASTMSWGQSSKTLVESLSLASSTPSETVRGLNTRARVEINSQSSLPSEAPHLMHTTHLICDKQSFKADWSLKDGKVSVIATAVDSAGTQTTIRQEHSGQPSDIFNRPGTLFESLHTALKSQSKCDGDAKVTQSTVETTEGGGPREEKKPELSEAEKRRMAADEKSERECKKPVGRRSWKDSVEDLEERGVCLTERLMNLEDEVEADLKERDKAHRTRTSRFGSDRDFDRSDRMRDAELRRRFNAINTEVREIARKLFAKPDEAGVTSAEGLIDQLIGGIEDMSGVVGLKEAEERKMVLSLNAMKSAAQINRDGKNHIDRGDTILEQLQAARASGDNESTLRLLQEWIAFQSRSGQVSRMAQNDVGQMRSNQLISSSELTDFTQNWKTLEQMIRTSSSSASVAPQSIRQVPLENASAIVAARSQLQSPSGLSASSLPSRNALSPLFQNLLPAQYQSRTSPVQSIGGVGSNGLQQPSLSTPGFNPQANQNLNFNSSVSTL